ncbi:MAG: hypothetical protein ACXV98_02830 [Ilumatobacteraceae bacterium]
MGFTFSEHVFSRSRDAQKIADHYRPLMSARGLADLRSGFESVKAAGAELGTSALPSLQRQLGLDKPQFDAYLAEQMPGIKAFSDQAPGVVALVDPVIGQMEAARADYHRADQIPTSFLGLTSAPWLFLGIGFALIVIGLWGLLRPSLRSTAALVVIGIGLAVAPIAIGIPGKIDAAVRVTRLGAVGLAPATGQKAVGATALFDGLANDVSTKLAPALATTSTQPNTFATEFPALATFTSSWQSSISAQSHALSDSQVALAATFANANKIPLRPIPWLFIVSGILLALLGVASVAPRWRTATAAVPAMPVAG